MSKMLGMNITVTLYRRIKQVDDDIGGRVSKYHKLRGGLPARVTASPSPLILRVQGLETRNFFNCTVWSENYDVVDVTSDDILVPESGQYKDYQFRIQSVEESSVEDNPNSYRAMNKRLSLLWETPPVIADLLQIV